MRLTFDYLQLRNAFPHSDGEAFRVTMEELAQTLFCTPRNAKIIIAKMIESGWVRFVPGRGRGNASELSFLCNQEELVLKAAQKLVENGDVHEALAFVKEHAVTQEAASRFLEWLSQYFGYQVVSAADDRIVETLRLPIYRPIVSLDPANAFYAFDTHLIKQIYSTLVERDERTGHFVEGLAHHWESKEGATHWTFHLRKGVLFHDGWELTAEDVKFTLQRVKEEAHIQSWIARDIETIEIQSRYKFTIVLRKPNYKFLYFMSHTAASILSKHWHETNGPDKLPLGTGPYQVAKLTLGICVLDVFQSYYDQRGWMDRIEIIIVPEAEEGLRLEINPGLLMVQTGEAAKPSMPQWSNDRIVTGCSLLTINLNKHGILQNRCFRKALFHFINRLQMVSDLGEPHCSPSQGLHLDTGASLSDSYYRPEDAAQALRESGYAGETIALYTFERHAADANWLQAHYERCGIRIDVSVVTWGEMLNPETIASADLILFEAVLSEGFTRLLEYYQTDNGFIRKSLHAEMAAFVDQMIDRMQRDPQEESIGLGLADIEQAFLVEYTCVWLTNKSVQTLSHPSLHGVKVNARGWVDFKNIWFAPSV